MTKGPALTPEELGVKKELAIRQRLKDEFLHYAARCLKIRPKKGGLIFFELNHVQQHIHERLQNQMKKTGKVRALILKARQPGCSTYVEGRFYWRVTHRSGVVAYILTHKQEATDNLFDMAARFHEHCPDLVKPHTGKSNAKELAFDRLDSGYKVGTAGTEGVGRSEIGTMLMERKRASTSTRATWPIRRWNFSAAMKECSRIT